MNDTNLLNSLLCSGINIDALKIFDSFVFTPLMWGKLIQDKKFCCAVYSLKLLIFIQKNHQYTFTNIK
jgi:hypothetical protein